MSLTLCYCVCISTLLSAIQWILTQDKKKNSRLVLNYIFNQNMAVAMKFANICKEIMCPPPPTFPAAICLYFVCINKNSSN